MDGDGVLLSSLAVQNCSQKRFCAVCAAHRITTDFCVSFYSDPKCSAWQQQFGIQGLQRKEGLDQPSSFSDDYEKLKTKLDSGAASIYVFAFVAFAPLEPNEFVRLPQNLWLTVIEIKYKHPTILKKSNGELRRVGFELEFTGLELKHAVEVLLSVISGTIKSETAAEILVTSDFGEFAVEIDWDYLKREARENADDKPLLELLSSAATLLVPIEIVCPPIAIDQLDILDPLVRGLRDAGAKGTDNSPVAAFGVHVNSEIASLDVERIEAYLKAFALLQWWLIDAHEVNLSRRLTPYIDLYPEPYLRVVAAGHVHSTADLIDAYLEENPTRNRALDMLPMFAEIDPDRVKRVIDDPRIKARPTFHYRVPNCQIDKSDWTLAGAWNLWWVVEELANRGDDLEDLCERFLQADRPLLGVNHTLWIETVDTWLKNHGLA